MRNEPKLTYKPRVKRDLRRCLQFLRRKTSGRVSRRLRELVDGVRRVRASPLLYPVRQISHESGAELRRYNVAQFAIIYAYFGPTPSLPYGEVSIRAIVHASEGDVWLEVRERGHCEMRCSLSTRASI
jgi:plasmid stabilization system protein ParE